MKNADESSAMLRRAARVHRQYAPLARLLIRHSARRTMQQSLIEPLALECHQLGSHQTKEACAHVFDNVVKREARLNDLRGVYREEANARARARASVSVNDDVDAIDHLLEDC